MGDHRNNGGHNPEQGSQSQDWVALDWVRGEIIDTLAQARQSLEAYVENSQDDTRLRFCQNYIHQVHGTLEMVEFYGAALLAEEMENLTRELLENNPAGREEALEILMQAILQLPAYLEQVQVGRCDIPVVILPILNDLRSARGENLLSETSLFSPDFTSLAAVVEQNSLDQLNGKSLTQLLKKLRQMYQFALVGFFKDPSDKTSKDYLERVFVRMDSLSKGLPVADLWPVAHALTLTLVSGDVANSPTVRNLFRQIDDVFGDLIEGGAQVFNRPLATDLLKNLLYYVAGSHHDDPMIQAVRERYRLEDALVDDETLRRERQRMNGPDQETMSSVVQALSEELMTVKDALDLFVRNRGQGTEPLSAQLPVLRQVADTLAVLGLGVPRKIILEQIDALSAMVNSQEHDDSQLMDVAGSLLYIEATLSGMSSGASAAVRQSEEDAPADLLSGRRAVVKESRTGLQKAKDGIVDFIASQWDKNCLTPVPDVLMSVCGSLDMIGLLRVASLMRSAGGYIDSLLQPSAPEPEWDNLEQLADVLAGAEYYLERLGEEPDEQSDSILDVAEDSLKKLLSKDAQDDELTDTSEEPVDDQSSEPQSDYFELDLSGFETDDDEIELDLDLSDLIENPEPLVDEPEEFEIALDDLDIEGLSDETESSSGEELLAKQESLPPVIEESVELSENLSSEVDDEEHDLELVEIFVEEAAEIRDTLLVYFPRWQSDRQDMKALKELRRGFHTLKGSGRMVGATVVGELAWSIENMLNRVLDGAVESHDALVELMEKVIAQLPSLVEDYAEKRQQVTDTVQACMDAADIYSRGAIPAAEDSGVAAESSIEESPDQELVAEHADANQADRYGLPQIDSELISIFCKEARVHLQVVNEFIEAFNQTDDTLVINNDLQRALHTLKGCAGMSGIESIADLAGILERTAKEFHSLGIEADEDLVSIMARSTLSIEQGVNEISWPSNISVELDGGTQLIDEAQALLERYVSEAEYSEEIQEAPVPSMFGFIAEHMNLVLDATPDLTSWNRDPADKLISHLAHDLQQLIDDARQVELDVVAELGEQLSVAYQALIHFGQANPDARISDQAVATLIAGQDHLINMMDEMAGQQPPTASEQVLNSLQALVEELEAEPSLDDVQDAVEELVDGVTESLAEEPLADTFVPHSLAIMDDYDPELVAIFLDEAMDNLDSASGALYRWLEDHSELSVLTELQRYLHTIKGGALMAAIPEVSDLSHELENIYEALVLKTLKPSGDLINLLLRGHDTLEEMLSAIRSNRECVPAERLCLDIRRVMRSAEVPTVTVAEFDTETPDIPEFGNREPAISEQAPVTDVSEESMDLEMLGIFQEEATDLLEQIERQLNHWQQQPENMECPAEIMRALHTLKGSARMTGLSELGEGSHNLEVQIQSLQDAGDVTVDDIQPLVDELNRLHQGFDAVFHAQPGHETIVGTDSPDSGARTEQSQVRDSSNVLVFPGVSDAAADSEAESGTEVSVEPVEETADTTQPGIDDSQRMPAPASALLERGNESATMAADREMVRVPADLLDQLVNLAGETSITRARIEQQTSDFGYTLNEMHTTIVRLQEQLRRLDTETQAQIISRHEEINSDDVGFDPLEMDQYSELTQLSRALVESATDLVDLKEALEDKNRDSETLLLQQSRINTELQEGLMRTRMLPFNRLVPRLRRIVRQVSAELGKQVELKVVNAEGEMDRSVMERMMAPLEHMLRNAIDHGIEETSAQRVACGKSEVGEISLNMAREGGELVLNLADDGRGLDLRAVRDKAVERGLLINNAEMSDEEISRMIIQPGFTTARNVTQISGRGVGMDVVNSELKQLGGHIDINTTEGQGTEFEIRLPFTLSVNRALLVKLGEDPFAIPLNTLEGIVRLSPLELEQHYRSEDGGFDYAGRRYQLRYLGDLLHSREPRFDGINHDLPVLLFRSGDSGVALHVDSLVASREIVVKSLGPQFAAVRGVSGATILGDGRVVVILDPVGLSFGQGRQKSEAPEAVTESSAIEKENNLIMVVDDSVTVRKVTGRLLKRSGYDTVSARDGVEAMALLQEHRPAVMLLDIEMPRMDGFEVATAVRNNPEFKDMPIIMITSRTGEKHRQRAREIGVDEYLGKPFHEGLLLETIGEFAKRHD